MKQRNFLLTLFLTVVMMAMFPQIMKGEKTPDYLCFTAEEKYAVLKLEINGSLEVLPSLEISFDGSKWVDYNTERMTYKNILFEKVGQHIYIRAGKTTDESYTKNETFSSSVANYLHFSSTSKISASGNVMSLLDQTAQQTTVPAGAFCRLFEDFATLTSAPELPATTLGENCYEQMFYGCLSLTAAPYLPATQLANECYDEMFLGCTKLNSISVGFHDWNDEGNATGSWVSGVAETGHFFCPTDLDLSTVGADYLPSGWSICYATPAACSTVSCLNDVCFTFPENASGYWLDGDITKGEVTDKITITDSDGNSVGSNIYPYVEGRSVGFSCDAILVDGTYTITIPKDNITLDYGSNNIKKVDFDIVMPLTVKNGTPSLQNVKTSPANDAANIQSLSSVTYTFDGYKVADWGAGISANSPTDKIIIKKDGVTIDAKVTPGYGTENNQLVINFDKIATAGTYTINIPAGCVKLTTVNGESTYPTTDDIMLTETVDPVEYTSSPADGETVESIELVSFYFAGGDSYGVKLSSGYNASIYDKTGNQVAVGTITNDGRMLTVSVDKKVTSGGYEEIEKLTDDGTYTIVIPNVAVTVDDKVPESDITTTLKISNGTYHPFAFTSYPESGSVVYSISKIDFTFPHEEDFGVVTMGDDVTVVNEKGESFGCSISDESSTSDATVTLSDAIVAPGTYTITIPAGKLRVDYRVSDVDVVITLAIPANPSVKLNNAGYATYSSPCPVTISTDGVKAYTATVSDDNITLNEITDGVIDAGEGVILYGEDMGGTLVSFKTSLATDIDNPDNDLQATTTASESIVAKPATETVWSLGADDNFYKYTGTTFKANRAYLVHELGGNAKMRMIFADDFTGIQSVNADTQSQSGNESVYNLNGQRVNSNAKGIILRNGHKYFNK